MKHFIRKGPPFGSSSEPSDGYAIDVTPSLVQVRCGRFSLDVPRSSVASAGTRVWTGKMGWRLQWKHVALLGSRQGVVEIRLREPVPHRTLGVFPVKWDRIVVSMEDPQAFLEDLGVPPNPASPAPSAR